MTSKLVVNTIEADTGISSVSFASSISMSSTSKFHFGNAGIDIGADTNIDRPAAGVLGFNINGSEKLRIDSSGRVMIGTTTEGRSTADHLTIASTGHTGMTIRSGTSSGGNISFSDGTSGDDENRGLVSYDHASNFMRFFTNATEKLRITSAGLISIGDNTNLDSQLTITQAQGDCIRLRTSATNNTFKYGIIKQEPYNNNALGVQIIGGKSDSGYSEVAIGGGIDGGYAATQIDFYTGATTTTATGTKKLSITSAGVIQLSNLFSSYTSGTATRFSLYNDSNNHYGLHVGSNYDLNYNAGGSTLSGKGEHRFHTGASERLRITSAGKVNIGGDYTASTYGLQVYGSGGNDAATIGIKNNTAGPAGIHLLSGHGNWSIFNSETVGDALEFRDESAGATRAMIDSSGRFIVGHNSNINVAGHSSAFLLTGNTYQQHTAAIIANENTVRGAMLQFAKQRSGSAGGNTIVQNGDKIGHMRFVACDGVDLNSRVAEISAEMDGAPGSNSTPGRLVFSTTPSGSDNALERLRINKDGHVTKPYQPSFRAGLNSNTTFASSADIIFNDTAATWHHNNGNHYNTSNGRFTAPVAGVYHFDACVIFGPNITNNLFMGDAFLFYINNGYACYSGRRANYVNNTTGQSYYTDHISCRFHLNATDYITVRNGSPWTGVHGNTYYTWFAGTLLG